MLKNTNKNKLINSYEELEKFIKEHEEKAESLDQQHKILAHVYLANLKNALSLLEPSYIDMIKSSNEDQKIRVTKIFEANFYNVREMIDENVSNFININAVYLDLKGKTKPIVLKLRKSHSVDLSTDKIELQQLEEQKQTQLHQRKKTVETSISLQEAELQKLEQQKQTQLHQRKKTVETSILLQESELQQLEEQKQTQLHQRKKTVETSILLQEAELQKLEKQDPRNLLDKLEAAIVSLELANQNQRMLFPQTQNKAVPPPSLPLILEGKNHLERQKINLEKTGKILKPVKTHELVEGICKTAKLILYETTRLLNLEQESRNLLDKLEAAIVSLELANQNQRMLFPQTQNKAVPPPSLPLILEGKNHLERQKINLEKTGKILKPVKTHELADGICKTAKLILYETTRLLNLEQEFVIPTLLSRDVVMAGEGPFQHLGEWEVVPLLDCNLQLKALSD